MPICMTEGSAPASAILCGKGFPSLHEGGGGLAGFSHLNAKMVWFPACFAEFRGVLQGILLKYRGLQDGTVMFPKS
jgi:hypothetical protein